MRFSRQKIAPTDEEVQQALRAGLAKCHEAYIILDALDEYLANFSDDAIRDLLTPLLSLGNHVKLMVTSRVLGGMEGIFKRIGAIRQEICARDDDMQRYIENRISKELPFAVDLSGVIVEKVTEAAKSRCVCFLGVKWCC